ncbi:MAG: hypothetical protein QM813_24335 [Verrucomicrobiota bacterium]
MKPHVGNGKIMRDPSIMRGPDGTLHLVWTTRLERQRFGFGYAHSKDLVHWWEQNFIPVMEHEPAAVNVWAPELFYDDETEAVHHLLGFDDSGPLPRSSRSRTTTITGCTTPLHTTSKPSRRRNYFSIRTSSMIDCHDCSKDARHAYVLVLKDNTRPQRNIHVAFGKTALGPWHDISHQLHRQN